MSEVNVSLTALADVYSALKKFLNNIEAFPKNVSADINSLNVACENEIRNVESKLRNLEQEKNNLDMSLTSSERSINICESRINSTRSEISSLESKLSSISRNDPTEQEEAKEISSLISSLESELLSHQRELDFYWSEYHGIMRDLKKVTDKLFWTQDKIRRMNSAFSDVVGVSSSLRSEINKFCFHTSEESGTNASSVALCIDCLEEYMNTDL
ncbi:MAG: hypothetical protein HDT47_09560 [Ruminococcaceae bacterium]|nr:hypothetical protein [Oscillospiraceae bacterium]